jgi:hypothetical protein
MASLVVVLMPVMARADVVTEWNEKTFAVMAAERVPGAGPNARAVAMVHGAMHEAMRSSTASREAAVHTAAREVLVGLFPRQKALVDSKFDAAIAAIAPGEAREAGMAAGQRAAAAMLSARANDGINSSNEYRPVTAPGEYVSTTLPVMTHVAKVKPFSIPSVSRFRPGGPPPLDSAQWARDLNETREMGGTASTKRTADQTEAGKFWVLTGILAWNDAARQLATSKPLALADSVRLFAQLNAAIFDATLAVFDAKYTYNRWRPATAIRNGDRHNNNAVERDASWTPVIDAPMHPEYPCAHCTIDGAAGVVLKSYFGAGPVPEFTLTFDGMPGVKRRYASIDQLEEEVSMARIWGGVHFRTSNEVGHLLGKHVGEYVLQNYAAGR